MYFCSFWWKCTTPLLKFNDCYAQTEFWVSIEGEKVKRFLQFFVTVTSHVQESNFIYEFLMVSQKKITQGLHAWTTDTRRLNLKFFVA